MAVKHLITFGIGFSTGAEWPLFQVTQGMDISTGPPPSGGAGSETVVVLKRRRRQK